MMVSSPIELYTVYLGWKQYDILWEACKDFGLAWLPFLGLFYQNMTAPFETPFGHGADTSLRRVLIELILMIIVLMFCVNPWLQLTTEDVHYTPTCHPGSVKSTVGNSGTTYDNVFGSELHDNVKVPALFALVMNWGSGFTNAAIAVALPCTDSVSLLMHTIETSRLRDETVANVTRFNNECYLPARAQFDAQQPASSTYEHILRDYGGEDDLTWMGSHVLQQLYYNDLSAKRPVVHFPYSNYPSDYIDDAIEHDELSQPEWGYPSCEDWWSDPSHGLQQQIVNDLDDQGNSNPHYQQLPLSTRVNAALHRVHLPFASKMTADDIMVRNVLYNSKWNYGGFSSDKARVDINGNDNLIRTGMSDMLIFLGQTFKRYSKTPLQRESLSNVLPIAQAIVLFLVLLFMPLILILGGYRMSVVVGLAFTLFAIIFLNYIWYAINFLEDSLLNAVTNVLMVGIDTQHAVIINFMTALYCGAPLFFISLMSITGVRLGSALNLAITSGGHEASSVANAASGIEGTVTNKLMGMK